MFQIDRVLNDIHGNGITGGHMGEKRTQANIAERLWITFIIVQDLLIYMNNIHNHS